MLLELITYAALAIMGLGLMAIAIPIFLVSAGLWFISIPLLSLYIGGFPGFCLGIGLDVIIFSAWLTVAGAKAKP